MSSTYWPEISFCIREIDRAVEQFPQKNISPALVEALRKGVSQHINQLKYSLLGTLESQYVTEMLFAFSALFDEEIQKKISESEPVFWPPLSKDFYGDYKAGEELYRCFDASLENAKTPPIVFEVFYFVLKRGFKGKYTESKLQISKYLDLLQSKVKISDAIEFRAVETIREPLNRKGRTRMKQYYYIAASLIFTTYIGLYFASNWA